MWEWAYKLKKQVDNDDNKESPVQQSDEDGTAPGEPSTALQDDTIKKPAVDGIVSGEENVILNGTTPRDGRGWRSTTKGKTHYYRNTKRRLTVKAMMTTLPSSLTQRP